MMKISRSKTRLMISLCCGLLIAGSAQAVIIDIDNGELGKLMAKGVPVIDIRTSPEWQQTGIIPGSHLLTFFDERGNVDPGAWLAKARAIAKPGDPVIVICRTGNRTKMLSQFLNDQAGYAKIYNVKNGINPWIKDSLAIETVAQHMDRCRKSNTC